MASKVLELFVFYMIYFIMKLSMLSEGRQQVPCLFIIGDSAFDNGNNNFRISLAKSNYFPYGIDYPYGPTGRFSNGKIVPDFLAELLGFDKPIPPFASAKGAEILKGVNYASAAAGILDETGKFQGGRFTMSQQLVNHGVTISKITHLLGNTTLAREHLNKCLYVVNMGSNEYVNNYLLPSLYPSSLVYTPQQFATIVINRYSQQLRRLYNYGARKIVVYGLGLIGCAPQELSTKRNDGSICNEFVNKIVQPFDDQLKPLIDALNVDLDDAQFILINATSLAQGVQYSTLGIKVSNASCCTVSLMGLCEIGKEICSNRNEYFFWDNYHLTEFVNRVVAARSYDAELPVDAYPIDIRRLVQQ